ncbi:two-component regulator propeller domain-containing protein [Seonamhaeicola sp. ML3]|uniref:hybrid sensor histidine kinase/response regulator transcription factor n=1 Tax=Seonamhaeicola sp. ML3 TaxID=2937786 RepID=UPI00200C2F84|nr:two-component regulator propeller domain-containing protein [Seonamhaeicola sp. ML3]
MGIRLYELEMRHRIFYWFFLFQIGFLQCQVGDFNFKNFNLSDGLSSSTVNDIKQDKVGQIWLATNNGLNKFNGEEVVVYRNTPEDKSTISSNDVRNILEDRDGNLWIGTYNGLNKYEPKQDKFKRYFKTSDKNSLSGDRIFTSFEMKNGNIWFGTEDGISIYMKKQDSFIRFLKNRKRPTLFSDIHVDKKNTVWLATFNGIIQVKRSKEGKFQPQTYRLKNLKKRFFIYKILELEPDVLALATKYHGFLLFDKRTKEFSCPEELNFFKNIEIKDLYKDEEQNLWLATTTGLFIVTPSKEIITVNSSIYEDIGSVKNHFKKIFKDKNGSIWLGTQDIGVMTWHRFNQNFKRFKNSSTFNNIANCIASDDEKNIYYGTEGGDLNKIDSSGVVTKVFDVQNQTKTIVYPIKTLYRDVDLLWIGVMKNGIKIYDLQSNKELKDYLSFEIRNYLKDVSVLDIKKGSGNSIWIATIGRGLVKYDTKQKEMKIFNSRQLRSSFTKVIYKDKKNLIVVGSDYLSFLEAKEKGDFKITNYPTIVDSSKLDLVSVYKDSRGVVWVGSRTRGLFKFTKDKKYESVIISAKNRIFTVNAILESENGLLWLSTDKGIVKYDPLKQESIVYNQQTIAQDNDFRVNAALKENNKFYFGAKQGVITFEPDNIVTLKNMPGVILSYLKIKNNEINALNKNESILKNISYSKEIILPHNNASFSINYAFPNYINPNNNQYAYRLKGLDNNWLYTKQTEAFYTLQNAGTYTFQVKAAGYDGVWNDKITELDITIKPAPWLTWWAYTIYFILFSSLVFGISWVVQSKSRLKDKLELELIAKRNNEELNKAKLQFFTNISHEFRTPLTLILGPLQNILNDYSGPKSIYKKLKIMDGSANHLLRLINRLMDFRKLESNQLKLEAAEGNIVKFLQEIFLSFTEYAKNGRYDYNFNTTHDEILVFFDRYKLERVFYNLISNAFKHTKNGGSININISKKEEGVVVEVQDSGPGIPDEYLDKIFDRFFEVSNNQEVSSAFKKGTGIGLSIARNIVKLHHGEILVKNIEPQGAVFTVSLKLGKKHLLEDEVIKNFKMSDDVSQYATQIRVSDIEIDNNPEDLLLEKKKYTILVAEDNTVLRSFIKEILKPKYNVILAENGKEALEKAIEFSPDLVISDVIMPEMVGTELCSKIKTTLATSHIPVILLTSRTSLVYKFEGLESGADDYISKPFNLKEFSLKIQNLLEFKSRLKDKFSSDSNLETLDISLTSLDEQLLEKAIEVVKANISNQDFNITHFSEELGVSRSMLFTKVKAWTNSTPNDFVREIRLNHAAKLLELSKFNVSEVAYEVGFKRPKYFSQCFQKKYGITPSEYTSKIVSEN